MRPWQLIRWDRLEGQSHRRFYRLTKGNALTISNRR